MTHKFCTIGTLRHHKVKGQWIPPRHWSESELKKIVEFNKIIRCRDPNELRAAPTAFNWKLFTSPSFCCYTILMFWKCCITLWVCNLLSTPLYTFFLREFGGRVRLTFASKIALGSNPGAAASVQWQKGPACTLTHTGRTVIVGNVRQRGCESERAREEQHKTGIDRGIISDRAAKRKSATSRRENCSKLVSATVPRALENSPIH